MTARCAARNMGERASEVDPNDRTHLTWIGAAQDRQLSAGNGDRSPAAMGVCPGACSPTNRPRPMQSRLPRTGPYQTPGHPMWLSQPARRPAWPHRRWLRMGTRWLRSLERGGFDGAND
jgi:hypothetical protein